MPVLPESLRRPAPSQDADPLRYLRGVLVFFLAGGAIIALTLGLSGVAPKALLLAALLWTLLGFLTGVVDLVLEPLAEFVGELFARVSSAPEESGGGVGTKQRLAELVLGARQQPRAAVAALEALQRDADRLSPADDIRIGIALADLYEDLDDPGRALGELRRLIDRYPERQQTVALRGRLARMRAKHFAAATPSLP